MPPCTLQRYDEPSISAVWPTALPPFVHPLSRLHQDAGDPPVLYGTTKESPSHNPSTDHIALGPI